MCEGIKSIRVQNHVEEREDWKLHQARAAEKIERGKVAKAASATPAAGAATTGSRRGGRKRNSPLEAAEVLRENAKELRVKRRKRGSG